MKIAAVVLAAGGSTRMLSPKQLLLVDGRTLIQRAVEAAAALPVVGVTVVLGANADRIRPILETAEWPKSDPRNPALRRTAGTGVKIANNPDWNLGMGSSIRVGVDAVLAEQVDLNAILITLCDQPHVTTAVLSRLLGRFDQGDCPAVAAGYSDTVGVPAVFGRPMFDALLSLNPSAGAKSMLTRPGVVTVPVPEAAVDLDTPDDFKKWQSGADR